MNIEPNLFSDLMEWNTTPYTHDGCNSPLETDVLDGYGILNQNLCQDLSFTGKYQMPVVQSVSCPIPDEIASCHRISKVEFDGYVPHFFTSDSRIERIWKQPEIVLGEMQRRNSWVIGPDFSVYADLLFPQQMWNIFRNKLIVAWWQHNGVKVIPNVSWTNYDYDCSFDGWPSNSVIAVNSTGIGNSSRCKAMWIDGYREMIQRLCPSCILRYGAKQEGELEEISHYYQNDNEKFSRHGRQ